MGEQLASLPLFSCKISEYFFLSVMNVSDAESLFHFQNIKKQQSNLNADNSKLESVFAQRLVGFIDSRLQEERAKDANNITYEDQSKLKRKSI